MRPTVWPSPAQLRLCIAQEMAPDTPLFNHAVVFDVPATVDQARMRSAVEACLGGHQALRGRFRRGGDVGWVVDEGPPATPLSDLVELGPEGLQGMAALELTRPFDLRLDAPVRLRWWSGTRSTIAHLTFHHLATDARTLEILFADIAARYDTGSGSATNYYDLVSDHWLPAPDYAGRMDEYALDVAGVDLSLPLPGLRRSESPPVEVRRPVPDGCANRVGALARSCHVTPFAVWFALWTRALGRLLDRSSFPMLVPVSTRRSQAELDAVGFFINSVVIPVRTDPDEPLERAVGRIGEGVLVALSRRDLPLHLLARQLDLEGRGQDNPLTQVSAQVLAGPPTTMTTCDGDVGVTLVDSPVARYPVSFDVQGPSGAQALRLRADPGLVEHARLEALADLVLGELRAAPTSPRPARTGRTAAALQPATTPHVLVEGLRAGWQAGPAAPAIAWATGRWDANELDRAVGRMASAIVAAGATAGDCALIDLPRSPQLIAAFVAALDANLVPVFIRDGFPPTVRAEIQRLTACSIAIGEDHCGDGVTVERLEAADVSQVPHGTAFVTFTSGSSGTVPKGVPTPVAGLVAYLDWIVAELDLSAEDRCLQLARPGFDALARDVLAPLRAGACVVIASEPARHRGDLLLGEIVDQEVSVIPAMVPTQLRRMVHAARGAMALDGLRALCVAGEPLMRDDVLELPVVAPACRFFNLYGPTETTLTATMAEVSAAPAGPARLPVGRPRPETEVHVVDRHGVAVPTGALGRIVITGSGVAPGYLGDGNDDAFGKWSTPEGPIAAFTTDDLGYWLDDGLRIERRIGTERKLHGERFDLVAVEAAITAHPAVRDAVVGIDGEGGRALLVANVEWADPDHPPEESEVRRHVEQRLAAVAVPRRIVSVDGVPRLANGKVDRHHPLAAGESLSTDDATEAVRRATDVVAQVVGRGDLDPATSLFDLGCDSLDLIEIAEAAGLRSGTSGALGQLFASPRIETIARLAMGSGRGDSPAAGPTLLQPLGGPDLAGAVRVIACPPAGSDAPVFTPLVDALVGAATVEVLRRPLGDRRKGTTAAWLEDHARRGAVALLADDDRRPIVLCGYSVGFVVAHVLAGALADLGARLPLLVGLNPSISGANPNEATVVGPLPEEPLLVDRWRYDLELRHVVPRRPPPVERTILFLSDDDRRRWDTAGSAAMARLPHPEVRTLNGGHLIDAPTMARVATSLRILVDGLNR